MSDKEKSNTTKLNMKHLNIGNIIFGCIFVFLVVTVIKFITTPHISVYEVRQGSILKDAAYTGLVIRDELVVKSTESGYINYFAQDNSKVKVGSNIYTLTDEKLTFDESASSEEVVLSDEEKHNIVLEIQKYIYDYDENNFSSSYDLKDSLKSSLGTLSTQAKLAQLDAMLAQNAVSTANVYTAADDGVVVYSVDGMESLTVADATPAHLDKSNYHKTEFANNTKINSGDTIYKIITSDQWTLMLKLDEETAEALKEKNYVKVKFTKANQTMWANLEIRSIDDCYLAYLSFDNMMIRYASERFLDVELILQDETGLKIPKTAEVEKDFYVVPYEYISSGGGNSTGSSVLIRTEDEDGNEIAKYKKVSIYHKDEANQEVYLDPNQFEKNDVLIKENSNDTYELKEKTTMKGVYCINKGYAVFKLINILCESDEYYIIEEGSSYGLSNYDHIALDSTNIKENDVVF